MAPKATTQLLDYPPDPIPFFSGIQLGAGVHAITGLKAKSGLEPYNDRDIEESAPDVPTTFNLQMNLTADVLRKHRQNTASTSLIVPLPAGNTVAFSGNYTSEMKVENETCSRYILLHWQRFSSQKTLDTRNLKLSADALEVARTQPAKFREIYGDYFVTGVHHKMTFTAIWTCTSATQQGMQAFQASASAAFRTAFPTTVATAQTVLSTTADIDAASATAGASISFSKTLVEEAARHQVQLALRYECLGNMGSVDHDPNDVDHVFRVFRNHASPVPYEVTIQHYSTVGQHISRNIPMDTTHYLKLLEVFDCVQDIQTTLDVLHDIHAIEQKRQVARRLVTEIHLQWQSYEDDRDGLESMIKRLKALSKYLSLRQYRHKLVMEMRSYQYADFIKTVGRAQSQEDDTGVWVKTTSMPKHVVGRAYFSEGDLKMYGLVRQESKAPVTSAAISSWSRFLRNMFKVRVKTQELYFPTSEADGRNYVIGFIIEDCAKSGKRGRFFIDRHLKLGIAAQEMPPVQVKNKPVHMNWKLSAYYIPSSAYDDSPEEFS